MLLALCAGHWPLPHFVAAKVCSIALWCCCCGGCKPSTERQSHMSCGDGSQDATLPCLTSPEVNRRTDRTDSLREGADELPLVSAGLRGGRMPTHATRRRRASSIPRQDGSSLHEQVRLVALLVFRRCIVPSHRHIVGETDSHAEEAWDWVGLLSNVYARQQNPVWSKNPKRLLPQCSLCHGIGQGAWVVFTFRCCCLSLVELLGAGLAAAAVKRVVLIWKLVQIDFLTIRDQVAEWRRIK